MQGKHHPQHQYPYGQVDVSARGRRRKKCGELAAIPDPTTSMTSTSAPTITRANAKMCVDGFEMPGDGNGDECVFLFSISYFYFYFIILFPMVYVLMLWFGAQGL